MTGLVGATRSEDCATSSTIRARRCDQNGPLMTMQTALKNTADSARNRPEAVDAQVPIE
jgi:hypothetical protein